MELQTESNEDLNMEQKEERKNNIFLDYFVLS
jgi:hypothetical protein